METTSTILPPKVWYTAVTPFDSSDGNRWQDYIVWSGLMQLERVVSLDASLCPSLIDELSGADWDHNIAEDYLLDYFCCLDYLLQRSSGLSRRNILAVVRNPESSKSEEVPDLRFEFCGYDLLETRTGISALLNCGGFPKAFDKSELNKNGLIDSLERGISVKQALREEYPDDDHAMCDVWAIWLMNEK